MNTAFGIIISLLVIALTCIFLIRKKKFKITIDFNKCDIFLFITMLFVTLITGIVYPDYIYDVTSYHSYLQQTPFIDKINFDFFPGRIYCIFLFALGDRMYYIFRYFLGYRAGTLLSFFLPIVLFYQTKKLLKHFGHSDTKATLLSYFIFLVIDFSSNIGNYYIDNLALIVLFEGLIIIITEENLFKEKFNIYVLALIFGIAVGIKVTTVFFIIPMLIYMLIKNRKDFKLIKIYDFVICFLLFILPFFVYALDNYKQTGSVLFPYYNTFFKSEYFELENWKDERFGISKTIYKFLWPIVVNLLPKYGDEIYLHDYSWTVGYIFIIVYIVKRVLDKKFDEKTAIAFLSLAFTALWVIFLEGYRRYGVLIPITWTFLLIDCLGNKIKFSIQDKYTLGFIYTSILFATISGGIYFSNAFLDTNNLKYVFKDIERTQKPIHIDGVWGATYDCVGYEALIREEGTPIYTIDKRYFEKNPKTLKMWYDKVLNNDIYVVIDHYDGTFQDDIKVKYLQRQGFEIEEIVDVYAAEQIPYINTSSTWIIVKVKYVGE